MLPKEYRVQDGDVQMAMPNDKGYDITNPKLGGPPPRWFKDASDRWLNQCVGCCLLVVMRLADKKSYDDYDAETPHHCTRRYPGETIAEAQRRLARGYVARQAAREWAESQERHEEARRVDKARPLRTARQMAEDHADVEPAEAVA